VQRKGDDRGVLPATLRSTLSRAQIARRDRISRDAKRIHNGQRTNSGPYSAATDHSALRDVTDRFKVGSVIPPRAVGVLLDFPSFGPGSISFQAFEL
jgi:hypothetical protein